MKAIRFITPEDAAYGFGLAGVEQRTTGREEAEAVLLAALADEAIGVVALDERLLPGIGEETLRRAEQGWAGVLVVLPAPTKAESGSDYVNRLVSRAIGYQVRIE